MTILESRMFIVPLILITLYVIFLVSTMKGIRDGMRKGAIGILSCLLSLELVFGVVHFFRHDGNTLQYKAQVQAPDRRHVFALYYGVNGNPLLSSKKEYWQVFMFDRGVQPKKLKIALNENGLAENGGLLSHRVLQAEFVHGQSFLRGKGFIRVLRDRYLVFGIGKQYLGLYDTASDAVLVNEREPLQGIVTAFVTDKPLSKEERTTRAKKIREQYRALQQAISAALQ